MTFWPFCFGLASLLLATNSDAAVCHPTASRFPADTLSPSPDGDTLSAANSAGSRSAADSAGKPAVKVVKLPAESYMVQRVAFVSDFLKRLNYQNAPDNKPFDARSRATYSREQAVRLLFDEADPRLNTRAGRPDPVYQAQVNAFIETVLEDTTRAFVPADEEALFAEVGYSVLYKNAPETIRFFLKRFHTRDYYAWKILDAEAPFLKPVKNRVSSATTSRDTTLYIGSETHETRFLNLYNHLQERHNLLDLVPSTHLVSPTLAALAEACRNGSVIVQQTQQVHLYLDTRRGWIVRLDDIERQKENSGWLITDLYPIQKQKALPPAIVQYVNRHPAPDGKTK